jgi:hypothetical protein
LEKGGFWAFASYILYLISSTKIYYSDYCSVYRSRHIRSSTSQSKKPRTFFQQVRNTPHLVLNWAEVVVRLGTSFFIRKFPWLSGLVSLTPFWRRKLHANASWIVFSQFDIHWSRDGFWSQHGHLLATLR